MLKNNIKIVLGSFQLVLEFLYGDFETLTLNIYTPNGQNYFSRLSKSRTHWKLSKTTMSSTGSSPLNFKVILFNLPEWNLFSPLQNFLNHFYFYVFWHFVRQDKKKSCELWIQEVVAITKYKSYGRIRFTHPF